MTSGIRPRNRALLDDTRWKFKGGAHPSDADYSRPKEKRAQRTMALDEDIPRICPMCKGTGMALVFVRKEERGAKTINIYSPETCEECGGAGEV